MIEKTQEELLDDLEFIQSEIENIKEKLLFLNNPVDICNTRKLLIDYCDKKQDIQQQLNNK